MQRVFWLFGLLAVGLLVLPTLPAHTTPAARPLAQQSNQAFGINSHIASRYPFSDRMNVGAQAVAALNVGWAREDFQWHRIEPAPGTYDWEFNDQAVAALEAQGLNIIGSIFPAVGWATPFGGDADNAVSFYPPDPQLYATFAGTLAERYPQIRYWQIWSEPSDQLYWASGPDPAAYAALLTAASSAIKAANPQARVISAGLVSPMPATEFLQAIANAGAWGAFDIVAIHPYTDPFTPEQGQIAAAGVEQVRALVERLGEKPLWATEVGWSSGPAGRMGTNPPFTEDEQANFVVRGATMLRAAAVERIILYKLKDTETREGKPFNMYGLIRYDRAFSDYGSRKPAFTAYRTLNQQLAGTTPQGMLTLGERRLVVDFENFGTWNRGDQPNGTMVQSRERQHTGSASARIAYTFPTGGNDFVVFLPETPPSLTGAVSQMGMWVWGDSSGHEIKIWLRDAENEILQYRVGVIGGSGWQFISTPVTGQVSPGNTISGASNRRLDLPAELMALVVDDAPNEASGSGTLYIDDITSIAGDEAYGARFVRPDGQAVDVLWSPPGGTVAIATRSSEGVVVGRDGTREPIQAGAGQFNLNVGPSPVYLIHTPADDSGPPEPAPPPPPPPAPAPPGEPAQGQRCFSETGFCATGEILAFWEQNGGLPVFGYPITPQQSETIEGRSLQLQWFERNRLELHPQNAPPYNVLLGRLGVDALEQAGRNWQDFPTSQPQDDCRYFAETQQNICGEFLAAWRADGLELDGLPGKTDDESLALFGLPISPPQTETLSDGQQYTVQWFERARFELHPENPPPFRVLFGLLGREVRGEP